MIRIIVVIFCLIASLTACAEKKEKKPETPPSPIVSVPPVAPLMAPITPPPYGPGYSPGNNAPGPMPGQIHQAFYRPSSFFADINNSNILEPDELKDFEEAKFNIFDTDKNGALDRKEMENFDLVDLILSRGGENLGQLNDEQKELYKDWRSFILSLKIKNPAGSAFSDESFAKCYPDKVCDEQAPGQPPGFPPHP